MMTSEMASFNTPWLTLSIFVPIVCGLILLAVGRDDRPGLTRNLSLIGSILSFLVTIPLYTGCFKLATRSWDSASFNCDLMPLTRPSGIL